LKYENDELSIQIAEGVLKKESDIQGDRSTQTSSYAHLSIASSHSITPSSSLIDVKSVVPQIASFH
jgi:hypothetical protein